MLKPAVALSLLLVLGAPTICLAQDGGPVRDSAQVGWSNLVDRDPSAYNWCKKEAFDFGVIGTYRRLYVLSCLNSDVTSAIKVSD